MQSRVTFIEDEGVMMRTDFFRMWPDTRLDVASAALNTAAPIALRGRAHTVDELGRFAKRACALPVGRGMLTMCTQNFKVRDSIPIPPLNLQGCTSDGILVANTLAEYQPESLVWPVFFNACAAGFRFLPLRGPTRGGGCLPLSTPDAADPGAFVSGAQTPISRHWVVYQTRSVPCPSSRAGLLLAAGVLGHLTVLEKTDIFSLLTFPQVHSEAMTISVMLGLSCSFRGTGNDVVFGCLLIHVQSLTPRVEEIEVPLDVQTSALVSIGLLCQQMPTNTFLIEMFLTEMSRLPSDEHCVNREGYALAAGFGLGLQLLGMGGRSGVPGVEDRLFKFMNGARREPPTSAQKGFYGFNEVNRDAASHFLTRALLTQTVKESCRSSCMRVYEGNYYNVAVSAPAAVMALGLLYLKTDRESVANQLRPPNQIAGMQAVSPLLCMLRTMMGNLILWSSLFASREALYATVPSCLLELSTAEGLAAPQVNYLRTNLGYCVAGAILALGLRHAGSMDADSHALILAELQGFLKGHIGSTGTPAPLLQRSTGVYEPCIAACCVALGLVMSGSGDLRTFTILQQLQRRARNSYGMGMAIAMSIGLLFLGGGHLTLATDTASIAALVLAFYPVWPRDPEDNTHHLLALRALYGLAVVPRVVQTVDAVSRRPVSVPIRVVLRKGRVWQDPKNAISKHISWTPLPCGQEKQEVRLQTPCLYPPPEMIERIEIRSTQHYPQVLTHDTHAITEYGLCVRILEKRTESAEGVSFSSSTHGHAIAHAGNVNERRLLDAVRGLFCQEQRTSMSATLSTIDSIKLLLTAQQTLLRSVSLPEDYHELISRDFGCAVEQTMQRRYQFIFSHASRARGRAAETDPNGGSPSPPHPLHLLLTQRKSFAEVVQAILCHPTGTHAFPCDFTALSDVAGGFAEQPTDSQTDRPEGFNPLDAMQVKRWIAEALHFYLDVGDGIQELRAVFSDHKALANPPLGKMHLVLQLKQRLMLPMATLEKLLVCCL
ncbi:unnamed protein product [Phytomonas sp. EM1]|nr:unnamed protein product [Phytomonas sp. EM1]|eukprot:CCW61623.1 unnamed protein product [Phytomonas sp. isolate EM1]